MIASCTELAGVYFALRELAKPQKDEKLKYVQRKTTELESFHTAAGQLKQHLDSVKCSPDGSNSDSLQAMFKFPEAAHTIAEKRTKAIADSWVVKLHEAKDECCKRVVGPGVELEAEVWSGPNALQKVEARITDMADTFGRKEGLEIYKLIDAPWVRQWMTTYTQWSAVCTSLKEHKSRLAECAEVLNKVYDDNDVAMKGSNIIMDCLACVQAMSRTPPPGKSPKEVLQMYQEARLGLLPAPLQNLYEDAVKKAKE